MFHNGGYALCDVAMRYVAISMGYGIMHDHRPTSSDYANGSVPGALAMVDGEGRPPFPRPACEATRGVNSELGEDAGNSPTRLSLKTPGPDLIFSTKYLGGN